jgi:hypothetical protein
MRIIAPIRKEQSSLFLMTARTLPVEHARRAATSAVVRRLVMGNSLG